MSTVVPTRARRAWPVVALAAAVAVIAGLLVPITAQAAPIALSGRVATSNNVALVGVPVSVVTFAAPTTPVATTTSKAGGSFSFPALAAGTYTLRFGGTATTFEQYLGATSTVASAQPITLTDAGPHQSWINAQVAFGGTLSGTVKTSTGAALKNYTVTAFAKNANGAWVSTRSVKSGATGAYSFTGVEAGYYRLRAADATSAAPAYAPVYSGSSLTLAGAAEVGVAPAASTVSNFVLGVSGKASGIVTGSPGGALTEKLAGVVVTPYRLTGTPGAYTAAEKLPTIATSSATGAYALSGLPAGTYTLGFAPRTSAPLPASGTVYGAAYLGGGANPLAAATFVVTPGSSAVARNIELAAGGSISGVIATSGALPNPPIPNVVVSIGYAAGPNDQVPLATTQTNASGFYSFDGLAPGDYRLVLGDLTTGDTSWVRAATVVFSLGNNEDRDRPLWLTKRDAAGLHPLPGFLPQFSPGLGKVGTSASITSGVWNAGPDVTYGYQWLRNGTAIAGATSAGYTYTAGDLDALISVRITARDFAYGAGSVTSSSSAPIVIGNKPTVTVPATVIGDRHVGNTLTVLPATFSVPGVVASYAWIASAGASNDGDVVGEGPTHVVTANDVAAGPHLFVIITYDRVGYDDINQATISAGDALPGAIVLKSAPKVTKAGGKLTASAGTWSVTPTSYTYTWHVAAYPGDPTVVSGKTLSLAGRTKASISVTVTAHRSGYASASTTRSAQTGAAPAVSGSLAINGLRRVGDGISAPTLLWTPFPSSLKYQWQYNSGSTWKNFAGATNGNLTIPLSLLGKKLRVVSTASTPGFAARSIISAPTGAVGVGGAPAISLSPGKGVIASGAVAINAKVSVTPGTWVPAQSSNGYRWKHATSANGPFTVIAGATTSSLVIPASLEGRMLFVDVTAARPGHATGSTTLALGTVTAGALAATKPPVVSHTGSVYSVSTGTWSPNAMAFSYAWYAFDEAGQLVGPLSSAASFDVTAVGNRPVLVAVTASAPGYSLGDSGLIGARLGTLIPSAAPTIVGSPTVGTALSSSATTWGTTTAVVASQWQYLSGSSWKNLAGATKPVFTPPVSLLGASVRLRMTVSSASYTPISVTTPAVKVLLGAAPVPGTVDKAPVVDNSPHSGEKITVSPGEWSLPGSTFGYQWRTSTDGSAWVAIPGATKAGYVIPHDRFGAHYSVVITAKIAGHALGSTIVTAGTTGIGYLKNVVAPKVTKSGSTLTVSGGTWNAPATSFQYAWQTVDPLTGSGTLVSTTASYTPVAADAGKYIRVYLQANRSHYAPGEVLVTAQPGSAVAPVLPSTVSGAATVGSVLTVAPGTWSVTGTSVGYQWLRNGVPIAGATNPSYTQVLADVGRKVSVRITASAFGHTNGVLTLVRPATVNSVIPTATSAPVIVGEYHQSHYEIDEKLIAKPGTWSVSGLVFSYQWLRSGSPIAGATGASYLTRAADLGAEVSVTVTARRANYETGVATSAAVSIIHWTNDELYWTNYLNIYGTGALGSPLTSNVVVWNQAATETYQWLEYLPATDTAVEIAGAKSKTYTPTATDGLTAGDKVYLMVTASRPGWADGHAYSDLVTIK